jgi:hypothetical protein
LRNAHATGIPAAAARHDQRPLCIGEAGTERVHLALGRRDRNRLDARDVVDLRARRQHVLGQSEHDGPRTARHRDPKRARDVFRNTVRTIDLRGPLDRAAVHSPVVDFLERLAVDEVASNLTHEHDQRCRILVRGMDAYRRI